HWNQETASSACASDLVAPHIDPYSGQPESKATPATIAPVEFAWRGFALTRAPLTAPSDTWWARVAIAGGTGTLLSTNERPALWRDRVPTWFGDEVAEYIDTRRGIYRAAAFCDGRLAGALFLGPADAAPQWDAVKALLETPQLSTVERRMALSGRAADGL